MQSRKMGMGDIADIVSIERDANRFPWSKENFQGCLKANYLAWVFINESEKILGYAIVQVIIREVHILNVCVKKNAQRQGIGRLIVNHIISFSVTQGSVSIILEVRQNNTAARQLYLRAGFNEIALRKGYYPASQGREDAIVMALDLSNFN